MVLRVSYEITKRMPGRVLGSHGVVRREGDGFRLLTDVERLTPEQRDDLIRLCDNALEAYRQRRGDRIYNHRRAALGDISGTDRYEVLKQAGFRCELCGVAAMRRWAASRRDRIQACPHPKRG